MWGNIINIAGRTSNDGQGGERGIRKRKKERKKEREKERKKEREKERKKEREKERKKERSLISQQQQIRAFIEQRKSAAP